MAFVVLTSHAVLQALPEHGLRVTTPLREICSVLYDRPQWHPRADDVMAVLHERKISLPLATVYNVMNRLYENRFLREVTLDHGQHFFDTNVRQHYHIYYVKANKLVDTPCDALRLSGVEKFSKGKDIERIDVIVRIR